MYKRAPRRRRRVTRYRKLNNRQRGGIAFLPILSLAAKVLGPSVASWGLKKIAKKIL